jgi:hypothetical protein
MQEDRLERIFNLAYELLRKKINGKRIRVDNEASLQLQFAAILQSLGGLFEFARGEHFSIELEKAVTIQGHSFGKSSSNKAKIDVYYSYLLPDGKISESCAVEMKFFKAANQREPNNRCDAFDDIRNLEDYYGIANRCYLLVATDHDHYVSKEAYSPDTADFDFREGASYAAGAEAAYKTAKSYGPPITLRNSYKFAWDQAAGGLHFLKLPVQPLPLAPSQIAG